MSSSPEHQKVQLVVANPTGLGLFGLAMVTMVAASQKLGWTTGLSFVIVYAVFLGATAQLMASMYDFKHNNIWGATVFGAYAFFWYAIAACWAMKMGVFGPILAAAADVQQLGWAFTGYLIFSLFMTIGAMEVNKVIFAIMVLIDILLAALALNAFDIAAHASHLVAAWTEMSISLVTFYACGAVVLNTHFGKPFMTMGKPFGIFK
ncbi:MAG: acetate uptake transporter [Negativicutes bacterium]|nr:acetate uptake transporter [Negativicutes bacterium]